MSQSLGVAGELAGKGWVNGGLNNELLSSGVEIGNGHTKRQQHDQSDA